MAVKENVLLALERSRGQCLSGSQLAEQLGVTRAAVHKAVDGLRAEGLQIAAKPGEGYCLALDDDSLTIAAVQSHLTTQTIGRTLLIEPCLSSTNTVMKEKYLNQPDGFTLMAEQQTGGRGRLGRSFSSPSGTGIYLTILLHPTVSISKIQFLTIAAAVAVAKAISETAGFSPQIKWVNDVLMNGRKLCGILTEATIEGESGAVHSLIVGIGVNLRPNPYWSEEVRAVAGALSEFGTVPRRAVLAAAVLSHFEKAYRLLVEGQERQLLADYQTQLCCLNQTITVISPTETYEAFCTGLDENGYLLIRRKDGSIQTLSSGEISIRL